MNQLIFLDTETTSKEPTARLVQLAYKVGNEIKNLYFKPAEEISVEAMSVHHITNERVADKPLFAEWDGRSYLADLLFHNIVVAHNAAFDLQVLKNEDMEPKAFICTYKVAQRLFDSKQYKLQFLRYSLNLAIGENVEAHNAEGDIEVLEALFSYLVSYVQREDHAISDWDIIQRFVDWSSQPVLLRRITFGKHAGMEFDKIPKSYLSWLSGQSDLDPDLVFTINHYLKP